jgi:Family of unknown function (DUF6152)
MTASRVISGLLLAAAFAGSASAHHSFAMYDRFKTVILSGIVKEYVWTSPHVTINILSEQSGGAVATWVVEGAAPSVLARGGWTASLLKPGDKISLGMHPRKDGGAGGLLADERQMMINGQPAKGVLWLPPYSPPEVNMD